MNDSGKEVGIAAWLVPVSGPQMDPLQLGGQRGETALHVLGRSEPSDLRVPPGEDRVSRVHCRLERLGERWTITDAGSRWGTFLNGVRLGPERGLPLTHGDYVRIVPWTFMFSVKKPGELGMALTAEGEQNSTVNPTGSSIGGLGSGTRVRTFSARAGAVLTADLSALLYETVASLHSADSEKQWAEILLDASVRGTGLANAAVLKPVSGDERVEVVAQRGRAVSDQANAVFSRTLVRAAGGGQTAELTMEAAAAARAGGGSGDIGHSIASMHITAAMCAPVMVGGSVAAYVYVDARQGASTGVNHPAMPDPMGMTMPGQGGVGGVGGMGGGMGGMGTMAGARPGGFAGVMGPRPGAEQFLTAVARMASLALANLKRAEVRQREVQVDLELSAAAEVQQRFLPPQQGSKQLHNGTTFSWAGMAKPGRQVGGDLFELMVGDDEIEAGKVVLAVGDVSGKGLPAALLMAVAHAYLQSTVLRGLKDEVAETGLASVVRELNKYICPRKPASRFITLWVGVIDLHRNELTYVDAGHGYARLINLSGTTETSAPNPAIPAEQGTRATTELNEKGGYPIGLMESAEYEAVTVKLPASWAVLVVSDGVVEQTGTLAGTEEDFGIDRAAKVAQMSLTQEKDAAHTMQAVMNAVESFARGFDAADANALKAINPAVSGRLALNDDATVVVVRGRC